MTQKYKEKLLEFLTQVGMILLYLFKHRVKFDEKDGITGIHYAFTHLPCTKKDKESIKDVFEFIGLEPTADKKYFIPYNLEQYKYLMHVEFNKTCTEFFMEKPNEEECATEEELKEKQKAYSEYMRLYYPKTQEYKDKVAKEEAVKRLAQEKFEAEMQSTIEQQPNTICEVFNKLIHPDDSNLYCEIDEDEKSVNIVSENIDAYVTVATKLYIGDKFKTGKFPVDNYVAIDFQNKWIDKCSDMEDEEVENYLKSDVFPVLNNLDEHTLIFIYSSIKINNKLQHFIVLWEEYFKENGIVKDFNNGDYKTFLEIQRRFATTEQAKKTALMFEQARELDLD